ncbi:hypothetical protein G7Y79_00073g098100 [Physcia stellaris]|nr:hypothetical protein G7Y79_00073g098100 [Physcia stellaris]
MFLELPISGLHRLFHTAPSPSHPSREKTSIEALTEDTHTYGLLYPDSETLLNTPHKIYPLSQLDSTAVVSAATSYDDRDDLDIQSSRDIRVLVAQDGNAVIQQPRVLYDSHPPASPRPPSPSSAGGKPRREEAEVINGDPISPGSGKANGKSGRTPTSKNKKSFATPQSSPSSPESDSRSAFWTSQTRRAGIRSSAHEEESAQARNARESREETDALLGCMFGQTGLPLASSTKLHINPPRSTPSRHGTTLSESPDLASSRLFSKRKTPLTRSMTVEDLQNTPVSTGDVDTLETTQHMKGPSILITRLFSVEIPSPTVAKATTEEDSPEPPQKSATLSTDDKTKQIKVPKYGVAVLIQLPAVKRQTVPSILQSHRPRLGSSHEESHHLIALRDKLTSEASLLAKDDSAIIDQDIERIVAHWSVLTRAVSKFEAVSRCAITTQLQVLSSRELSRPTTMKGNPQSSIRAEIPQKKYKQPSQRTVQLPSQALHDSSDITNLASEISQRIASALKTRRVLTGQGRWGVWREEARWVGRWAGGKEQNFFFFNLLTAFLGNHTEWMDSLHPNWLDGRRVEKTPRETHSLRHRTVIVSADKMAARRLVFLLSAFLPSSYASLQPEALARPFTSRSSTGLSGSPPAGVLIPRERSLRRTINRKSRGNRTGSPIHLHERSISFNTQDMLNETTSLTGYRSMPGHSRRTSDTRSIRSLALPIPTSNADTRKSSIATLSTMIPDSVAVPHFASPPTGISGTTAAPRPGSSGSLASLSLRRTLSRSESTVESLSPDSPSASRWGSMLSGFWSTRRGSSTDHSDPMGSPRDGLGISGMHCSSSPGKLAKMVEELDDQSATAPNDHDRETLHGPPSPGTIVEGTLAERDGATAARDIPERVKAEEFPMKLSIDTNDGVVDVDLPMSNSYSSSFDSTISSPRFPRSAASSFNDHASTYGRSSLHSHTSLPAGFSATLDVAGYLQNYQPDFALQAVRPYKGLKEEITASMRSDTIADVTSSTAAGPSCTTLIADATTFSITRLTLSHRAAPWSDSSTCKEHLRTQKVTEEPVMDLDPTLISAVERVITHSQPSSAAHSRAPSPSHQHGSRQDRHTRRSISPQLEIPRSGCRTLILGALEQVAKSVAAEQHAAKGRDVGSKKHEQEMAAGEEADSTLREGVRRWLCEVGRQGSHG